MKKLFLFLTILVTSSSILGMEEASPNRTLIIPNPYYKDIDGWRKNYPLFQKIDLMSKLSLILAIPLGICYFNGNSFKTGMGILAGPLAISLLCKNEVQLIGKSWETTYFWPKYNYFYHLKYCEKWELRLGSMQSTKDWATNLYLVHPALKRNAKNISKLIVFNTLGFETFKREVNRANCYSEYKHTPIIARFYNKMRNIVTGRQQCKFDEVSRYIMKQNNDEPTALDKISLDKTHFKKLPPEVLTSINEIVKNNRGIKFKQILILMSHSGVSINNYAKLKRPGLIDDIPDGCGSKHHYAYRIFKDLDRLNPGFFDNLAVLNQSLWNNDYDLENAPYAAYFDKDGQITISKYDDRLNDALEYFNLERK